MYLLDSIQSDVAYEVVARSYIAGSPNDELTQQARGVFEDPAMGWRVVARCLAELSPSLLRRGDSAMLSKAVSVTVPHFYYELQNPPPRREIVESPTPYVQL